MQQTLKRMAYFSPQERWCPERSGRLMDGVYNWLHLHWAFIISPRAEQMDANWLIESFLSFIECPILETIWLVSVPFNCALCGAAPVAYPIGDTFRHSKTGSEWSVSTGDGSIHDIQTLLIHVGYHNCYSGTRIAHCIPIVSPLLLPSSFHASFTKHILEENIKGEEPCMFFSKAFWERTEEKGHKE